MGRARRRRPDAAPWRRAAGAVVALVALGGCRADVSVEVETAAGGGGRVVAVVRLDGQAVEQVPDLADQLRVDDLEAAGWVVEGPTPAPGGGARLEASKPFSSTAGARRALDELGGPSGPFRNLRLAQDRGFWRTRTTLSGTVDLSAGLGAFGDDALAEELGSPTLGVDPAALERELGRPLGDVLGFEVVADLAGRSDDDAPGTRAGDAVWPVPLGATVEVRATSVAWNAVRLVASAVAVGSGLALLVVVVRRSRGVSWG